jgi:asparaginyl-tRNA synthetase
VYTFGPTFRAENSNTSRHLAEFWMIEPEIAFCDLDQNIDWAENFLKYVLGAVLEQAADDMDFFDLRIQKGIISQLQAVIDSSFARISYSEAVAELQKSAKSFEYPVSWGVDLQSEHEKFLTEEVFKGPVAVTDYPKDIKAFYMRLNDDEKTVRGVDVLVPRLGEIIGGSQREERLDVLTRRIAETGLKEEDYWWYLDLRRFGTVPHSGFGLGFERLIQYVTGMQNIRDVIPFPRRPGALSSDERHHAPRIGGTVCHLADAHPAVLRRRGRRPGRCRTDRRKRSRHDSAGVHRLSRKNRRRAVFLAT